MRFSLRENAPDIRRRLNGYMEQIAWEMSNVRLSALNTILETDVGYPGAEDSLRRAARAMRWTAAFLEEICEARANPNRVLHYDDHVMRHDQWLRNLATL